MCDDRAPEEARFQRDHLSTGINQSVFSGDGNGQTSVETGGPAFPVLDDTEELRIVFPDYARGNRRYQQKLAVELMGGGSR
jgi:hypothetical protein